MEDVVADNSSSSGFLLGAWNQPHVDLSNLGMLLEINGLPTQIGSSAAILGHPVRSLTHAARLATQAGESLKPGSIIMAGGATAAHALRPGDYVRNIVQDLGFVSFSVSD